MELCPRYQRAYSENKSGLRKFPCIHSSITNVGRLACRLRLPDKSVMMDPSRQGEAEGVRQIECSGESNNAGRPNICHEICTYDHHCISGKTLKGLQVLAQKAALDGYAKDAFDVLNLNP